MGSRNSSVVASPAEAEYLWREQSQHSSTTLCYNIAEGFFPRTSKKVQREILSKTVRDTEKCWPALTERLYDLWGGRVRGKLVLQHGGTQKLLKGELR